MRKRNKSHFARHLLALIFLSVFVAGSFGLATVYLRQQIAVSAAESRTMERRLADVVRMEAKLTGEIAAATSPFFLEAQNQRFNLGLRQPHENQVVRVDAERQIQFAQHRSSQMARLEDSPEPNLFMTSRN